MPEGVIRVTVLYSPAQREVQERAVVLAPGATVMQALQASGLIAAFPDALSAGCAVGIWGRKARPEQTLRDRDRVEIYRPLQVDPKVARRERFKKQGARAPGLFARKVARAKAGEQGASGAPVKPGAT